MQEFDSFQALPHQVMNSLLRTRSSEGVSTVSAILLIFRGSTGDEDERHHTVDLKQPKSYAWYL